MEADIKLDGARIVLEGDVLQSDAYCLMLDRPDRRVRPDGYRRAIEHGPGDQLVLNYKGDYPGGVRLVGDVSLTLQVADRTAILGGRGVVLETVSLNEELLRLRDKITELEDRLAALGG